MNLGRKTVLVLLLSAGAHMARGQVKPADPLHAWVFAGNDPTKFDVWVNQRLDDEKADIAKLLAVKGPRTIENTLRPYDDAQNHLTVAQNNAFLMFSLGATAQLRDKGQSLTTKINSAITDLSLDRRIYDALSVIPLPSIDAATRHYLERALLEYRLAGVNKGETARARIRVLQDQIADLSLKFARNIADSTRKIQATRGELDGLPDDYIARLKPAQDGTYTITTDEPDLVPVMKFAKSPELRRRMFLAYTSRAYPQNVQVLRDLLSARQELASTLGYEHYSNLASADQMLGAPSEIEELIRQIEQVSRPVNEMEHNLLITFAKGQNPNLTTINESDDQYWTEQYRRARYSFDTESVRPYFAYKAVQDGILKIASRFFHVTFRPMMDAVVWDKSVDVFDVFDAVKGNTGKLLGRIYFDMHPREGKDKWFSNLGLIPGIRNRQIPEGVLMCNFSGGVSGDPGLMQYGEVVTLFHEFGHLMHHILGSQGHWAGTGGFNVETDFIESPSLMLEELIHDPVVLQSFAIHFHTGEVLPVDTIKKMNDANAYQRAQWVQYSLFMSAFALEVYSESPGDVEFDTLWKGKSRYLSFAPVEGDHYFTSFSTLPTYASNVYAAVLDKVIAVDFFSQFDRRNLLDGPTAMRYRRTVLEPGASKPAKELVKDFLGRPQNINALKQYLNQEFQER